MDIETINGADTTSRKDGCELLHLARRRANKHDVQIIYHLVIYHLVIYFVVMIDAG